MRIRLQPFIWQAWKFIAAREREQNSNVVEVPIKNYWDIHTAAEAEAMEAEMEKEELTTDIEADFRSTVGLMTAAENNNAAPARFSLREGALNSLQKLKETIQEISQPIPDKESMIPKEPPAVKPRVPSGPTSVRIETKKPASQPVPVKENAAAKSKAAEDKKINKNKAASAPKPQQLPLVPVQPEAVVQEETEMPPEPVFEENDDHNGSGLLSAPSLPEKKEEKKSEKQENVMVRSRTVKIDEEKERVETTTHDYSFVPSIPEKESKPEQNTQPEDPWIMPDITCYFHRR